MAKSPKTIVDRELIHELTKLLDETGLTEIEIEQDGKRVRVARGTIGCRSSACRRTCRSGAATLERKPPSSRSIRRSIPAS